MDMQAFSTPKEFQNNQYAGEHLIVDLWKCDYLTQTDVIEAALSSAAIAANATVLQSWMHSVPGGGVTGVVLLAESHISIHTWPEHDYAAV